MTRKKHRPILSVLQNDSPARELGNVYYCVKRLGNEIFRTGLKILICNEQRISVEMKIEQHYLSSFQKGMRKILSRTPGIVQFDQYKVVNVYVLKSVVGHCLSFTFCVSKHDTQLMLIQCNYM